MESIKHQNTVKIKHFIDAVNNDDLETIKCSIASLRNKCQINRACIVEGEKIRGKFTPLSYAVKTKKLNIVSFLLETGADVNCKGWFINKDEPSRCLCHNPLFLACVNNDPGMIKILAENGAHINIPIPDIRVEEEEGGSIEYSTEDTCLHWAVRNEKEAVVMALLQSGANPNKRNHFDTSPLHIACEKCNFCIMKELVRFGGHFEPDVISWIHLIECLLDYDVSRAQGVSEERKKLVLFLLSTSYSHRNSVGLELLGQIEKSIENTNVDHYCVNLIKHLISNPSPLIQICRATIRKCIGQRCKPGVMSCLPLPSNLEKYLSLDY
ncbi:hypothetical protein CHS0354_030977 [Potamilus streckersoni]|uniref:SOCS box domain-containing protein n=1 Tax=Potamilus streckersoni TaxID=2493646 RepID=A0AAE0SFX0_9BIVA|nr:hypothetical protein CHS0354_030977 [Potamilus streckersoni]